MPLRDHFRSPLNDRHSWDTLHGMWPAAIVIQLRKLLPAGYIAGPTVHLGSAVEVDIGTFNERALSFAEPSDGGVAVAAWAPPKLTVEAETELSDFDEYEVRVYDVERERQLVAAIEIVSPSNKDRPEHRQAFITKCAALIQQGVAVSIIDIVTTRQPNLYCELMSFLGHPDRTMCVNPPEVYVGSCRWSRMDKVSKLQAWSTGLVVGERLPILPLWLAPKLVIPLDLEVGYEQACHDLWIS